ncbi:uncharacterized protein LOC116215389 [Punica granatum]|uniref:Uncharacterized protein LOC116215389 n=2 Tax=Punica granatum TaxID=22663 RepID=A0A6P8EJS1_PUNGR|nr:uncharacterized protein LOC116215389 [Punica granatum]XP_031406945.1 uncharacterized protein LOC116215389 [Punica granatum]PKI55220.1 hypothetical protein CRG98_024511 [Punica granatum]
MSEKALRDHNTLPGSDRKPESTNKGTLMNNCTENVTENLEERQRINSASLVSTPANGNAPINCGGEVGTSEIEYIDSEKLTDVEDVDIALKTLLAGLDSKDWLLVCDTLNNARRLALFHKEVMLDVVGDVIAFLVKSLKNPRSAVCKTGIMTSTDIFHAYNDQLIDFLDPLLVQLLLKSSQDKKFVCEAAEKALVAMTSSVSPTLLLPKLQPHLKHRNPRIRAKASVCFCRSVLRLGIEGIKTYGIDKLIQTAASQLSDQLPESREAARTLLLELQTVYEKSHDPAPSSSDPPETSSWENFCQLNLSPLNAQAVLRVTNAAREGFVLGS